MSPVSSMTSSGMSQTIRSQASTTLASISRCSGKVEPIDTTTVPGLSHCAVEDRRLVARARAGDHDVGARHRLLGRRDRRARDAVLVLHAGGERLAVRAVGLNTRSAEIGRTSLSASVCEFASEPLPSTATVFGPGRRQPVDGDRRGRAGAERGDVIGVEQAGEAAGLLVHQRDGVADALVARHAEHLRAHVAGARRRRRQRADPGALAARHRARRADLVAQRNRIGLAQAVDHLVPAQHGLAGVRRHEHRARRGRCARGTGGAEVSTDVTQQLLKSARCSRPRPPWSTCRCRPRRGS